ncbi:MAG: hypothetical protein ACI4HI_18720 [Lachnospiraceae bacterium]
MRKKMKTRVIKIFFGIMCVGIIYAGGIKKVEAEEWKGEGTKENPYLIENEEDLWKFARDVNSGNSYEGKWFKQTNNIDLNNKKWTSIGIFGSSKYFYGTYDGDGHYVENLKIESDGNNSFFGQLGGTVMNFGIESGEIKGAYLGSISSHATKEGKALILNCYNRATVTGIRAGGIADCFNGEIKDCWSDCTVNGEQRKGGIVSYKVRTSNCYGVEKDDQGLDYHSVGENYINSKKFAEKLTKSVYDFCEKTGSNVNDLYKWEIRKDGKLGFSKEKQKRTVKKYEGKGTKENPYLIQNSEELRDLAWLVNTGNDYKGKYFRQTENIDLENKEWIPIGLFGREHYFYGIYDGNGHYVKNLKTTNSGNGSFFGQLGGTVINFGIESGKLKGAYLGSISSHAVGTSALIMNCYNKATVMGNRAGGIVDNFDGKVINCWNIGKVQGTEAVGGVSSYGTRLSINCYGIEDDDHGKMYEKITMKDMQKKDFAEKLRNNIEENAEQFGFKKEDFNDWEVKEGKVLAFSEKKVGISFMDKLMDHWKIVLIVIVVVVLVAFNFYFQKNWEKMKRKGIRMVKNKNNA